MNNYSNSSNDQLAEFETPFADIAISRENTNNVNESYPAYTNQFLAEFESPFSQTFEIPVAGQVSSPLAGEFVNFLSELEDPEFGNNLYELAAELEDTWNSKISNEVAMGDRFIPFATQQAMEYFAPLIRETDSMIDRMSEHFSGNNLSDHTETDVERFFTEIEFNRSNFTPAQEQLFGSFFKKVKSTVKKGIDFAKKGVSVLGKFLPMNIILGKLKGLIGPLLEKVLKFAINKLPKNLQGHAQTLAKKYLNIDTPMAAGSEGDKVPATGDIDAIQTELDNHFANLVFSRNEIEADDFIMEYESSSDAVERFNNYETGGLNLPSLQFAREQFINQLKELQPGETPAPAIERFLPVIITTLKPVIKGALAIIGRQKVINFLAGLLTKLIGKFVPENVAKPLAASIIDKGMVSIGFETHEMNKPDVAYEALANTIQETIQNMRDFNEENLNDNEALTMNLLEAFETAAADNFPAQYIKEELRPTADNEVWAMNPRNGQRHMYKKYSKVFPIVITPQAAKTIATFRDLPLANFLRDKLGLDPSKPINARVHLYEGIVGTKLSQISHNENLAGLGPSYPYSWVQLHPLSKQAASLLLQAPALGKDFPKEYTTRRRNTAAGQRFYYLEINGARLRMSNGNVHVPSESGVTTAVNSRPAQSGDIRGIINFVKSEIRLNYYFSEEEAKSIVERLNKNDVLGAATIIRYGVENVLEDILIKNINNKVKIVHEAFPEMYLENYNDQPEHEVVVGSVEAIRLVVKNMCVQCSGLALAAMKDFFGSQATVFKKAQAQPDDGVSIKITWINISGMSTIKKFIDAIRSNQSIGNLSETRLPTLHKPEIKVVAGKQFD